MQLMLTKIPGATLEYHQERARNAIDAAAGKVRARYITVTAGQSETYQQKADDCASYKAAGYPADVSSYPWVMAEAAAQGVTHQVAADLVLSTKTAWSSVGAAIEEARLYGKRRVTEAATVAEISAAASSAISTLLLI